MPKVTGPLKTVLQNPTQVTGAWIRSGEDRPDGDGMILDEPDKATLTNGVVSFTAAPGPAVLVLQRAGGRLTTLKLMVGTADSSLADAVSAGSVANHLDSHRLAQLVGMIETTQKNVTDAAAAATRAEDARNQAENMVASKIAGMSPMVWVFHGTGTPTLAGFPGARVGDVIRRMSDGQVLNGLAVDTGKANGEARRYNYYLGRINFVNASPGATYEIRDTFLTISPRYFVGIPDNGDSRWARYGLIAL